MEIQIPVYKNSRVQTLPLNEDQRKNLCSVRELTQRGGKLSRSFEFYKEQPSNKRRDNFTAGSTQRGAGQSCLHGT